MIPMDTKLRNLILIIIAVLLVLGVLFYFLWAQENQPSKLDAFAKCINDSGAKFYGAFWCPHCQDQKSLFGSAKQYLPYIECSTPDSNGQLQVCTDQKVKVYPTWHFSDGSVQEGELSLQELADKTKCSLPN